MNTALWIVQCALALLFVFGGGTKLVVRGEMLPQMFGILYLTANISIGDVVYTATDRIRANRNGTVLRYIHPVLTE